MHSDFHASRQWARKYRPQWRLDEGHWQRCQPRNWSLEKHRAEDFMLFSVVLMQFRVVDADNRKAQACSICDVAIIDACCR
jgi:hypothetical protein